jgi:hypothetical protein
MTPLPPFIFGFFIGAGGSLLCVWLGFLGSVLGHHAAERHIARLRLETDEAHGDMPSLPYRIPADDADQTWGR